jgi:hypothetical protein
MVPVGMEVIANDRTILPGMEVVIWIPEKRLAIDFNGAYWHSEKHKDRMYHQSKTLLAKSLGIRLIHFWEWELERKVTMDWLRNLFVVPAKVRASKCDVLL